VSVVGIQAETVEDVQKAVCFAVKRNLRLVVKSSGHDYFGRSAAAESFLLWMHKLNKNISITTAFVATQVFKLSNSFPLTNHDWYFTLKQRQIIHRSMDLVLLQRAWKDASIAQTEFEMVDLAPHSIAVGIGKEMSNHKLDYGWEAGYREGFHEPY
jgi:hypothetical protein